LTRSISVGNDEFDDDDERFSSLFKHSRLIDRGVRDRSGKLFVANDGS